MPIFLPAPEHNPRGPDGHGWNRIAVHGMCLDECALKPKTMASFFDALDTRKARYGCFGPCVNGGNCDSCELPSKQREWGWFGNEILVRVDDTGVPWVMNRPDKGWEEYGKRDSWIELLKLNGVEFVRYRDEFGVGVMVRRIEA